MPHDPADDFREHAHHEFIGAIESALERHRDPYFEGMPIPYDDLLTYVDEALDSHRLTDDEHETAIDLVEQQRGDETYEADARSLERELRDESGADDFEQD